MKGTPEKIAEAIRLLGRENGMQNGGEQATLTIPAVASAAGVRPSELRLMLTYSAAAIWGKLPMGWTFALDDHDSDKIHLQRRIR